MRHLHLLSLFACLVGTSLAVRSAPAAERSPRHFQSLKHLPGPPAPEKALQLTHTPLPGGCGAIQQVATPRRPAPGVLLISGPGLAKDLFPGGVDQLASRLAEEHHRVAALQVDWECVTQTPDFSLSTATQLLQSAIRQLSETWQEPVTVLAFGTAAPLVISTLAEAQSLPVQRLVLLAPIQLMRDPERMVRAFPWPAQEPLKTERWFEAAPGTRSDWFDLLLTGLPPGLQQDLRQSARLVLTDLNPSWRALFMKDGPCCSSSNAERADQLRRVQLPTLVLGGLGDTLARAEDVACTASLLGSAAVQYRQFGMPNLSRYNYGHLDLVLDPTASRDVANTVHRWMKGKRISHPYPSKETCMPDVSIPSFSPPTTSTP